MVSSPLPLGLLSAAFDSYDLGYCAQSCGLFWDQISPGKDPSRLSGRIPKYCQVISLVLNVLLFPSKYIKVWGEAFLERLIRCSSNTE